MNVEIALWKSLGKTLVSKYKCSPFLACRNTACMIFLFENNFSLRACQNKGFFRAHCCYSVYMYMWPLFLLSSSSFFSPLSVSWFFFNAGQKVPECLHYANLYLASWICCELRKQRRAAGWAAVAAHGACPLLTLSPGPRDAWQMEAWHSALAGYTRLSVSYLSEQKLLWATRASHLGHIGRKSHLLTEFYWVMMELSFMVSRWGLSGFRWWLALLAE